MRQRDPRRKDPAHLDFLRSLPCCICGDNTGTEAAHLRFSDARVAKENPGVGQKPHDIWALPVCGKHHREQHEAGDERKWWSHLGIDPIFLALALHWVSGNHEGGMQVLDGLSSTRAIYGYPVSR